MRRIQGKRGEFESQQAINEEAGSRALWILKVVKARRFT
jgi:hypothetical protein